MAVSKGKSERVDIRLNPEHKDALVRASALEGLSLSDFIVLRSLEAARDVIRKHAVITLSPSDLERFSHALDEDAAPNEALKRAAQRYLVTQREASDIE